MFRKFVLLCVMCCMMIPMVGCVTLKVSEKYQYEGIEKRLTNVGLQPERVKDPALAGTLNILPGFGNAYLGQWGLFAVNLLFWPISVVWGIPQAASDASVLNKQSTIYFYSEGEGKVKLAELEAEKKQ
jgi:hypothetical protein